MAIFSILVFAVSQHVNVLLTEKCSI